MKKILVLTRSLSQGGITSFLIPLTNLLSELGNEVTLAYTTDDGGYLNRFMPNIKFIQYTAPNRNESICLWLKNLAFFDMAKIYFRRSGKLPHYPSIQRLSYITAQNTEFKSGKYDVAISTAEGYCNALVATKIHAKKKIGWVHPDMSAIGLDVKAGNKILKNLDNVVAVSESGYLTLKNYFKDESNKFLYIENLLDSDNIIFRSQEDVGDMPSVTDGINVITVCRITNESKRLDRVIKIANILRSKAVNYKWYIVGDGPDSGEISKLIYENKLQDFIIMLGGKMNPLPYIKKADCFVLTSQYEGKPVVIEEAKILHTPVIVTEYTSAKSQVTPDVGIVIPNVDGILEEDIANILADNEMINNLKKRCVYYNHNNIRSIEAIKSIIQ